MANFYHPSRKAITNFLSHPARDHSIITDALQELRDTPTTTDHKRTKVSTNIEALKIFNDTFSDTLELDTKDIEIGDWDPPKLTISNVDVSIRPNLITYENNSTDTHVGAIKLYFKKNDPLKAKPGKYTATALYNWVEQYLATSTSTAHREDTIVYDVFSAKTIQAPKAHINREKDIAAACTQIQALWPHV